MSIRSLAIAILFCLLAAFPCKSEDGDTGKKLTQEEFCVELIHNMDWEKWLPLAATGNDCVKMLERVGIAPLKGWDGKSFLAQEDYLVIMAKVRGKENLVHERALAVEEKNREVIDRKWQEDFSKRKEWASLKSLLQDKTYFPEGAPESPYGFSYRDSNQDHKVDVVTPLAWRLVQFRQKLAE